MDYPIIRANIHELYRQLNVQTDTCAIMRYVNDIIAPYINGKVSGEEGVIIGATIALILNDPGDVDEILSSENLPPTVRSTIIEWATNLDKKKQPI